MTLAAEKKRLADEAERKRQADETERKRLADEAEKKIIADSYVEADLSKMKTFINDVCGLSTANSIRVSQFLVVDNKLDTVKKLEKKAKEQLRSLFLSCPGMTAEDAELILDVTHKSSLVASLSALAIGGAVAIICLTIWFPVPYQSFIRP